MEPEHYTILRWKAVSKCHVIINIWGNIAHHNDIIHNPSALNIYCLMRNYLICQNMHRCGHMLGFVLAGCSLIRRVRLGTTTTGGNVGADGG